MKPVAIPPSRRPPLRRLAPALRTGSLAAACVLLAGCSLFKSELQDAPAATINGIPEYWVNEASSRQVSESWLDQFGDVVLQALVEDAWENNAVLLSAIARRDAATARAAIDKAGRVPKLDLQASVGRQHQINDFLGNSTVVPQDAYISRIRFGLGLSWELDLWNRTTDLAGAALNDVGSAILDVEAAKFSLAGQTATAWFTLIAAEQKVQIARDVVANLVQAERIATERERSGLVTTAELLRTRTDLAAAQSEAITRQLERDRTARLLQILIGAYPSATLIASPDLPTMPSELDADIPSNLLERRPDVQAAGLRVVASDKRLLAAKKNLLPRFSINGSFGTQSKYRDLLFDNDSFTWAIGGGLLQPLFDGGQIKAGIRAQRALLLESVQKYREKVYSAFREVEDALGTETALRAQLELMQRTVDLAVENETLAQRSFDNGTLDTTTVLSARRGTLQARSKLVDVQLALLNNRVTLNLALGGSPLVRGEMPAEGSEVGTEGRHAPSPAATEAAEATSPQQVDLELTPTLARPSRPGTRALPVVPAAAHSLQLRTDVSASRLSQPLP